MSDVTDDTATVAANAPPPPVPMAPTHDANTIDDAHHSTTPDPTTQSHLEAHTIVTPPGDATAAVDVVAGIPPSAPVNTTTNGTASAPKTSPSPASHTPASHTPALLSAQSPYPEGGPETTPEGRKKHWLIRAGEAIFHGIEFVGEVVAGVIGIDEAKYQDIMDSMSEEELAEARRVNDIRNAEYEVWLASQPAPSPEDPDNGIPSTSPGSTSHTVPSTEMTSTRMATRNNTLPPSPPSNGINDATSATTNDARSVAGEVIKGADMA